MVEKLHLLNATVIIIACAVASAAVACVADEAEKSGAFYEAAVADIVTSRCLKCHAANRREGGLDLSTSEGIVAGGDSGVVIDHEKPEASLLLERIVSGEMPPEDEPPLTAEQKAVVRTWIEAGAKFRNPPRHRLVSQHDVIPILLLRCTVCHGTRRQDGGLDLRTRESILKGGQSGPVVVSGKPGESLLIQKIRDEEMPPRRKLVSVSVKPMTDSELKILEAWIRMGLPFAGDAPSNASIAPQTVSDDRRAFWSFVPPSEVTIPLVDDESNNPIDVFVAERLAARGLKIAPPADRQTLLRRVYFDLTGLPPNSEAVDESLQDAMPGDWKRLIERLLASPRYGERWARHWLDAAGYADSEGAQNEDRVRPHLWRYRDYVIRSFNDDKPYDRFLHEQIAGDELADYSNGGEITQEVYDNLVATGFLRTTPDRTFADITNFVPDRLEVIADEMQVFSSAVLGLTLQCARCHDHKFDPLSQRDYYSLTAIFKDAYDEHDWLKSQGPRTLPHVTAAERAEWERQVQQLNEEIASLQKQVDAESSEEQQAPLKTKIDELNSRKPAEPRIRALWSRGQPSPTYLLRRGNYLTPGDIIDPNVPAVLTTEGYVLQPTPPGSDAAVTGRRLALAGWLTRPEHPLTARVLVNRIWRHHFGQGLVATVSNFGTTGSRPSHPELLDWLAMEFVRHDWSVKWLHRQILTSRTWLQSSVILDSHDARGETMSEEERVSLLYGAPLRRMEAEVVRDALLSVAGQLDLTPYGSPDGVTEQPDGLITSSRTAAGWRRSIFVLQRRTKIPTLLENFDAPQMGPNCLERSESTVAPQALHLLNNAMVHDLARHFADRVTTVLADQLIAEPQAQIREVYRLALSRNPTLEEQDAAIVALGQLREHWRKKADATDDSAARNALGSFCHAIMNSAEFLYID